MILLCFLGVMADHFYSDAQVTLTLIQVNRTFQENVVNTRIIFWTIKHVQLIGSICAKYLVQLVQLPQ